MKNRLARLTLAAGLLAAVGGPLASSAGAFACAPDFQVICTTYGKVCQHVPAGQKVDPHALLCESLA